MIRQQTPKSPDLPQLQLLSQELRRFREHLEADTSEPVACLELNAALLLSDLCRFLGLSAAERSQILGQPGTSYHATILATRVSLPPNQQRTYED